MYSATSQFRHHLNTGTLNMTENDVSLDKKLILNYNVQSTWLRRQQNPLVQSRGADSVAVITS